METLYNVYFAGETLEGEDQASVRDRVAKLFNANEATLDTLFNGKLHLVKRDCDKATALKYKEALERAGARPVIKHANDGGQAQPTAQPAPQQAAERPMTAAEKIAALAAAADENAYQSAPEPPPAPAPAGNQPADNSNINLAPPETEVLRPEERAPQIVREVDTGDLAVNASAEVLSESAPPPPPPPDVSHLSMGEVGEDIPTLDDGTAPLLPNTDALSLSPEGTDFSDCAAPEAAPPELDLSELDVAPEGSDVLEEQYKRREAAVIPTTDHIELEN